MGPTIDWDLQQATPKRDSVGLGLREGLVFGTGWSAERNPFWSLQVIVYG